MVFWLAILFGVALAALAVRVGFYETVALFVTTAYVSRYTNALPPSVHPPAGVSLSAVMTTVRGPTPATE